MISIVKASATIIIIITGIIIPFCLADKAVDFRNTNIDICNERYMHKKMFTFFMIVIVSKDLLYFVSCGTINDNHVHNILRLFEAEQIFLSPQEKQSVIINNKLVYPNCVTSCQTI